MGSRSKHVSRSQCTKIRSFTTGTEGYSLDYILDHTFRAPPSSGGLLISWPFLSTSPPPIFCHSKEGDSNSTAKPQRRCMSWSTEVPQLPAQPSPNESIGKLLMYPVWMSTVSRFTINGSVHIRYGYIWGDPRNSSDKCCACATWQLIRTVRT